MNLRLNRFNAIVPYYDVLSFIFYGNALYKAQRVHLCHIPPNSKVLVLGGGTGRWLKEMLESNDTVTIWYVEASSRMIDRAKQNSKGHGSVKFIHGTQEDIPTTVCFDVVIAFFYFDMFNDEQLSDVITIIDERMHEKSIWIVADFIKRKRIHDLFLFCMYAFFRLIGAVDAKVLPRWREALQARGLIPFEQKCYFFGFVKSYVFSRSREKLSCVETNM